MKLYEVTFYVLNKNRDISFELIVDSNIADEDIGLYFKKNYKDFNDRLKKYNGENITVSYKFIRNINGIYLIDWTKNQPRG